jgi:AMIN domain
MHKFSPGAATRLVMAAICVLSSGLPTSLIAQTSVRQVKVMGAKEAVEVEVEASDRIIPETQVVTGPDRLVVDFPNAVPGPELRSQSVNRGEVKSLRIGLFQSKPPITRVVLDLKTPQNYQIFPNGRTVIIKVLGPAAIDASNAIQEIPQPAKPGLINTNFTAGAQRIQVAAPSKPLEVSFHDGLLAIRSTKATLSEVLYAVQQRTGADIAIPAGAEQEKVVANLGPGPAQEILAHLLNGSKFNFLILNSANDPRQLDRVILSPREEGVATPPPPPQPAADADDDDTSKQPPDVQPTGVTPTPPSGVPARPVPPDLPPPDIPPPSEEETNPQQ